MSGTMSKGGSRSGPRSRYRNGARREARSRARSGSKSGARSKARRRSRTGDGYTCTNSRDAAPGTSLRDQPIDLLWRQFVDIPQVDPQRGDDAVDLAADGALGQAQVLLGVVV